jgi:hypothetical protein
MDVTCNQCGFRASSHYQFCPSCGAQMDQGGGFSSGGHGGDSWETPLVSYVVDRFQRESGLDAREDSAAMTRIRDAAANVQTRLDRGQPGDFNLPFLMSTAQGPKHLQFTVTAEEVARHGVQPEPQRQQPQPQPSAWDPPSTLSNPPPQAGASPLTVILGVVVAGMVLMGCMCTGLMFLL